MIRIGDRVGALLSETATEIKLLGYGIYMGEQVPTEAVGPLADMLREAGASNPCIKLDSGKYVFGCECWWDTEATIKARVERSDKKVVALDIEETRKDFTETETKKRGFWDT